MLKTFEWRDTVALFDGARVRRFANFTAVAIRKLRIAHAATRIESSRVPQRKQLEWPLLATDVPGSRTVVTYEVDGLLVPANAASTLASATERLHQYPAWTRQ